MERKIQEAIRYLGIKKGAADAGTRALVESSFQELMKEAEPKSICRIFELQELGDGAVQIGKLKIESRSLARNLKNCRRAVLFGATLGTGTDYTNRAERYGQSRCTAGVRGRFAGRVL